MGKDEWEENENPIDSTTSFIADEVARKSFNLHNDPPNSCCGFQAIERKTIIETTR